MNGVIKLTHKGGRYTATVTEYAIRAADIEAVSYKRTADQFNPLGTTVMLRSGRELIVDEDADDIAEAVFGVSLVDLPSLGK